MSQEDSTKQSLFSKEHVREYQYSKRIPNSQNTRDYTIAEKQLQRKERRTGKRNEGHMGQAISEQSRREAECLSIEFPAQGTDQPCQVWKLDLLLWHQWRYKLLGSMIIDKLHNRICYHVSLLLSLSMRSFCSCTTFSMLSNSILFLSNSPFF